MDTWEYKVISCTYQYLESSTLFKTKGAWFLTIDKQAYRLTEGLNLLGQEGWQLAGIQAREMEHGRSSRRPDSYYVFKRIKENNQLEA